LILVAVTHELIHSDWVVIIEEMGINIDQNEDSHNEDEKYVCPPGTMLKIACATNNHHTK